MIRATTTITDSLTDLPIIFWDNIVTADMLQAESDPDFPASNVVNPSTALKWKQDITGSPLNTIERFIIDIPASATVNYLAIAGHNFSSAGIRVGLELASAASPLPVGPTTAFDPEIPDDDGPLIFLFARDLSPDTQIEGLVLVFDYGAVTTPAEMAVVYAGEYTVLPEGIQADHTPLPMGLVSDVATGKSENGAFLGRIVTSSGLVSSATVANIAESFATTDLLDFLQAADEFPFFWAWAPVSYPEQTAFGWLENDAQPVRDVDGYWSIDLAMRGIST